MKPIFGLGIDLSFALVACAGSEALGTPVDPSAQAATMYRTESAPMRASNGVGRSASPLTSTRAPHAATNLMLSPRRR
jgi:hypothetical protein